uniref:Furostanol glycoside 26-O-beta-glucosidase n=1 Tax=Hellenia speciosa TaxID=49577 RepID=F26G_HELSP|nr:RecName: Full=Furostanol glycoside 26-O-beta-glucosidase; Short=CsF26G; AltName: Full=Protodioscin 26-O-beta-D-glucosidase; Flags: Precursor [Hellenia speciosa]BAA11831.1 furostanol glycoside 26-O-beta-glucosidase (F26G) [Hellenia speciosa]
MAAQLGLPLVSCHRGASQAASSSAHLVPGASAIMQAGNRRQKMRAPALRDRVVFARVVPVDGSVGFAGSSTEQETAVESATPTAVPSKVVLGRSSFPRGFIFGAASAAYQVEGAWNEGGRGPSIWDTFTHDHPEKIADHSNGDKATDSYKKYKEDVKLLKDLGLDSYRFSISWSRILPKGTLQGGINQEGIQYYNDLINELLKNGIRPMVTLFHWDVPQALEDSYKGFRSSEIVNDFKDYADICFKEFGDRVKHWITLNEPWSLSTMGYAFGRHAPGRCSTWYGCPAGDSANEPYEVTHNLLLAHANAVKIYRDNYKATQNGEIGITLNSLWYEPYSKSHEDVEAATRALDFMFGWYMDPLVNGDYPFIMRALVRDRLPFFTHAESELIKGSYDFIGINYYTSNYAQHAPVTEDHTPDNSYFDSYVNQSGEKNGVPIGPLQGSWIYFYPRGLKELLLYVKRRYCNPKIYITENGTAEVEKEKGVPLHDPERKEYLTYHLAQVLQAIREGVRVKGHFTWALTDNFEWDKGYTERFGLIYIDYDKDFNRQPKDSTKWFSKFLRT